MAMGGGLAGFGDLVDIAAPDDKRREFLSSPGKGRKEKVPGREAARADISEMPGFY